MLLQKRVWCCWCFDSCYREKLGVIYAVNNDISVVQALIVVVAVIVIYQVIIIILLLQQDGMAMIDVGGGGRSGENYAKKKQFQ